jgi:hypothetical protein
VSPATGAASTTTATSTPTATAVPTNGPTPTTPIASWGNDELYVIDLATGIETRLTDNRPFDGQPTWSPDGSRIAFRTNRDGGHPIECSWETAADMAWYEHFTDLIGFADIAAVVTVGEPQAPTFDRVEDDSRGQRMRIFTATLVTVEQFIFGEQPETELRVRQEGGTIGDCVQHVTPTADLAPGRRYILLLTVDTLITLPDGFFLVAANQSVLEITPDDIVVSEQYSDINGLSLAEVIDRIRADRP